MTDIVAVMFLIGIGALLIVLLFVFRNALLAVSSALAWGLLALYNFNRSYSGDPDAGIMTYAFGWFCTAMGIILITSPMWLFKKVAIVDEKKDNREQWEIDDEKRRKKIAYLSRYRPKKRRKRNTVWEEE